MKVLNKLEAWALAVMTVALIFVLVSFVAKLVFYVTIAVTLLIGAFVAWVLIMFSRIWKNIQRNING